MPGSSPNTSKHPASPGKILPILALIGATAFWGSSFLTVSTAVASTDPFTLVFMRFTLGALLVFAMLRTRAFRIPAATWKMGAICATAIYGGYLFNHIGLETLMSSTSGFLTALYVPITPFLFWAMSGRRPDNFAFCGALIAFAGLVFLANPTAISVTGGRGEIATIIGAFLSAFEIILMGRYANRCEAKEIAFTQICFVALYALIGAIFVRLLGLPLHPTVFSRDLIFCVGWLAVLLTGAQLLLAWGQKYVPPAQTAVIFALESVFAAIIGWIAGERLGVTGFTGGALIVAGILVSEMKSLLSGRKAPAEVLEAQKAREENLATKEEH